MAAQRIRPRREPALVRTLRRRSAGFYAVLTLVAALLSAVVYTVVAAASPKTLQDQIVHEYFDSPPGHVTIDWQLYKAPLAEASCRFIAVGRYEETIGSRSQTVGPNNRNERTTNHTVVIPLPRGQRAVSATIASCRITRDH